MYMGSAMLWCEYEVRGHRMGVDSSFYHRYLRARTRVLWSDSRHLYPLCIALALSQVFIRVLENYPVQKSSV